MRYSKLIISDDLEMKAISDHYSVEQAAVLAINAGCDLLIYKGDAGIPISSVEAIIKAVEKKVLPIEKIEAANARILAAKKVYTEMKRPLDVTEVGNFIGLPEHFQLADIITRKELPAGHDAASEFDYR